MTSRKRGIGGKQLAGCALVAPVFVTGIDASNPSLPRTGFLFGKIQKVKEKSSEARVRNMQGNPLTPGPLLSL